jgi:putative ABC transport system ATP-binding protein
MCAAMVAEAPTPTPVEALSAPPPAVSVERLDHHYGEGAARNQVLFDNCITIPPGQLVVMTGPSGAGKTTLLTLIGALRSLQEGRIEVLGRDLSRLVARDLVAVRREIGFIFQMHNLFDALTAFENVKMAMQLGHDSLQTGRGHCFELLEQLGLGHRIDYKPRLLSGGERQRVAIARALVNRPRLVLADEPTAALDKDATRIVIDLLKQSTVEYDAAVIMVTHDFRVIECADRLVHMVDGRIVSDVVLHDALRICEFLRAVDLFQALTPTQLTAVAEKITKRHFAPGETIIREGEPGEEFFLISNGEVDVVRADHEVARLGRGEFFGEVALISGEPRNATVVANEPLDTFVLGKSDFQAAVVSSPSFREQLYRVYFVRH